MKTSTLKASFLATLTFLASCQEDKIQSPGSTQSLKATPYQEKVAFGKVLASAFENEDFRALIKEEAIVQFDDDYDVFYQSLKSRKLPDGKTVEDLLVSLQSDGVDIKSISKNQPLLTIFVPELKEFSAEKWNVKTQIPIVGIRNVDDVKLGIKLAAYDADGSKTEIGYQEKPHFPLVILKDNERVINANSSNYARVSAINTDPHEPILVNELGEFSFWSNSFDKRIINARKALRTSDEDYDGNYAVLEPELKEAYENNSSCQRDNLYYRILPQKGRNSGTYRLGYSECITGIKMSNSDGLAKITDQLSEGNLEFAVNVFMTGPTNNALSTHTKGFPAQATDLYDFTTKEEDGRTRIDQILGTKYYSFYRIPIIDWNMKSYGDTWKFAIAEVDNGSETTLTSGISSTFGSNYTNSDTKNGISFGTTTSTQFQTSFTYKSTNNSDQLAEGVLHYCSPVVKTTKTFYNVPFAGTLTLFQLGEKVETGWCELAVVPMKIF